MANLLNFWTVTESKNSRRKQIWSKAKPTYGMRSTSWQVLSFKPTNHQHVSKIVLHTHCFPYWKTIHIPACVCVLSSGESVQSTPVPVHVCAAARPLSIALGRQGQRHGRPGIARRHDLIPHHVPGKRFEFRDTMYNRHGFVKQLIKGAGQHSGNIAPEEAMLSFYPFFMSKHLEFSLYFGVNPHCEKPTCIFVFQVDCVECV